VQLDLLRENLIVAEIVAKTGKHRAVVEGYRSDTAIL
jgi:hypothetical protein